MIESNRKPICLHPSAQKTLGELKRHAPRVYEAFTDGLYFVTLGEEPASAKALVGFGDRKVLELRKNDRSGTYRAVYTVRLPERVYVLHVFQKKSRTGIATDKSDLDLIKSRLKWAITEHAVWLATQKKERQDPS